VEHRTLSEPVARARDNMISVYRAIGCRAPNAESELADFGIMCRSSSDHPVGNFAITDSLDKGVVERISNFSGDRRHYFLYSFQPIGTEPDDRAICTAGFRHAGLLTTMIASSGTDQKFRSGRIRIEPNELDSERRHSAELIASQFFPRQSTSARQLVADSTATCDVPSYRILVGQREVGAVMLCVQPKMVGVYNFCIESMERGAGYGRAAMQRIFEFASAENSQICLQCDANLVDWYEALGFSAIENVDVWSLEFV
jgi:hypothetical protein